MGEYIQAVLGQLSESRMHFLLSTGCYSTAEINTDTGLLSVFA